MIQLDYESEYWNALGALYRDKEEERIKPYVGRIRRRKEKQTINLSREIKEEGIVSANVYIEYSEDEETGEGYYGYMKPDVATLEQYEYIYVKVGMIAAAIDTIAENIFADGFHFEGDPKVVERVKKIISEPEFNFPQTLMQSVKEAEIFGNGYIEIVYTKKNGRKIPSKVRTLHPRTIRFKYTPTGRIVNYFQKITVDSNDDVVVGRRRWNEQTKTIVFEDDELFHIRWNRIGGGLYGRSVIEHVVRALDIKTELETDMRRIMHRYAAPILHYRISTEGYPLGTDELEAYREEIEQVKPDMDIITTDSVTIDLIGSASRGRTTLTEASKFLDHIMNILIIGSRVPPILMGLAYSSTEATANVMMENFQRRIRALRKELEVPFTKITRAIAGSNKIRFVWGEEKKTDPEFVINLFTSGIISRREARELLGIDTMLGRQARLSPKDNGFTVKVFNAKYDAADEPKG